MKMLRIFLLVSMAAALWAQPAAPPEVDHALRARVTEFLDYHVRGEFRKAEALVADDTKDTFYNRNKPRYAGCKGIAEIRYSDNFSKAYVVALCTIPMMIQASPGQTDADGKAPMPMGPPSAPIPMTWKVEKDGKWYWYLDPEMDRRSPFGVLPAAPTAPPSMSGILPMVTPGPGVTLPAAPPAFGGTPPPAAASADPGMMAAIQAAARVPVTAATFGAVPAEALHHVKLEKPEVTIEAGGKAQLKISSDAEDARQLMVLGQIPGVDAKLESPTLKAGQSVELSLKATKGAKSGVLNIVVASTGEMLPVKITVK